MKAFVSLLVVAGLAAGGWFGYEKYGRRRGSDEFITATVDRGDIVATVSATGTVQPITKVLVGSQVSGTVTRWYADFNHSVKQGDLLLELDQDRYKTAVAQRDAAVKVAQARAEESRVRLADAEREFKRIDALAQRKVASDNEHLVAKMTRDAAAATLQASQAELESAQAELESAKVDLSKTQIASPIEGVVISRDVDAGQTVAASLQAPTLFTIAADLKKMEVDANVAESDVGRIREGMSADFRVDAFPDRRFAGTVRQVRYNPTVVDNIVTYVTIIDVDNRELLLRPGMTATVTFEVAKAANAVRVPNAALRFSLETPAPPEVPGRAPSAVSQLEAGPRLYVLQQGRPQPVPVQIGLTDGSFTELRSGLDAGVRIIIDRRWSAMGGGNRPQMPRGPRMM
ncbi:MAG: efflux RND transporter periplasmic adaptor subunit [Phycisphaerae bacterium]